MNTIDKLRTIIESSINPNKLDIALDYLDDIESGLIYENLYEREKRIILKELNDKMSLKELQDIHSKYTD